MSETDPALDAVPPHERLLATLPVCAAGLRIRRLTRRDFDRLAAWPEYPFPYREFAFSFRTMCDEELDDLFANRQADPARLSLVVDRADEPCVAYLALLEIDWDGRRIGNVAVRVHPTRCDRGIGTDMLRAALRWIFDAGMDTVLLDVAASNARAIRCYEKAGFEIVGETWRPAPDLADVDISAPEYTVLRGHIRCERNVFLLRFWEMQAG